jgi:DNA-binding response OmpR family regulator
MRLLLVEDDTLLGDGIRAGLVLDGYSVDWVRDGESAHLALLTEEYSACILDLGLPRRDGLSVLKELRARGKRTPVLILTARDTVSDKIKGLDMGADDYLLKPIDLTELQARLRALLRRASGEAVPLLALGELTLDPSGRRVTLAGKPITLSAREYALLHDLLSHKGRIRSRQELETSLYAWGEEIESNAVEVYIHHLRKKIGSDLITTVRGLGYVMGETT